MPEEQYVNYPNGLIQFWTLSPFVFSGHSVISPQQQHIVPSS